MGEQPVKIRAAVVAAGEINIIHIHSRPGTQVLYGTDARHYLNLLRREGFADAFADAEKHRVTGSQNNNAAIKTLCYPVHQAADIRINDTGFGGQPGKFIQMALTAD